MRLLKSFTTIVILFMAAFVYAVLVISFMKPAGATVSGFTGDAGLVLKIAATETPDIDLEREKILKRVTPNPSKSGFVNSPKSIKGEVYAVVIGVKDGDTFLVDAFPWPGVIMRTVIRLFGADTPEKRTGGIGGAQCDAEVTAGKRATTHVKNLLPPGTVIQLKTIFLGKYAGRTVAEVFFEDVNGNWKSLLSELIAVNLAVPYFGGTKQKSWC